MARDYARNRNSRRNARIAETTPRGGKRPSGQRRLNAYRQPRGPRTFFWLMTGILLGLLIAGGLYAKFNRQQLETAASQKITSETKTPAKESHSIKSLKSRLKTSSNTPDDDPEIAELSADHPSSNTEKTLSKTTASKSLKKPNQSAQTHYDFYTMLPKNDLQTSRNTDKEKSSDNNSATTQYQLQIGSFSKYEEADHLKAQLILQGYNASIQKHPSAGMKRYRVVIGPFNTAKEASAEQQRLSKNDIKSILLPR